MEIGVASTDRRTEEDWIMDELDDRGIDAVFIDPSTVSYLFQDGSLTITQDERDLTGLDLLFMRRTRFDVEASRDLVAAFTALGTRTIERRDVFFNPLSKFYSMLSFVDGTDGIDIPATGIATDQEAGRRIAAAIGYPVIVKPVAGREGEDVVSVENEEELETAFDTDFPVLVQEQLDVVAEYRVLVVGDEALGTVRKEGGEGVVRNVARGAEFVAVDRPGLEPSAVAIAQRLGIEVAGVDVVETVGGDYYELECNRCPQFTGFAEAYPDIDVPAPIVDYLVAAAEE